MLIFSNYRTSFSKSLSFKTAPWDNGDKRDRVSSDHQTKHTFKSMFNISKCKTISNWCVWMIFYICYNGYSLVWQSVCLFFLLNLYLCARNGAPVTNVDANISLLLTERVPDKTISMAIQCKRDWLSYKRWSIFKHFYSYEMPNLTL